MEALGLPQRPVVKSPPSNSGDAGSIPGQGTKIPHALGQLSPCTSTREPAFHKTTEPRRSGAHVPQLEREKNSHHNKREACAPQ